MMKKKILSALGLCLLLVMSFSMIVMAEETTTVTSSSTATKNTTNITTSIATPKMSTVTRKGKGKTTISWSKISKASGYQIQYSTSSDYKSAKTVTIGKASTTSKSISGMSTSKDTYIRMRAYKKTSSGNLYTKWSANVKIIVWKSSWKYAKNSKIHSDPAVLYYSSASKKKNITVAVNAGHGCKGGSSKKTLCHPNGSKKVTGGSTGAGAKYATAINSGTDLKGCSEASANLKIAKKLKSKLLADGYNVLMIRQDSNTQLDNIARTVMANNNAKCHIAIHFDSTSSNKGAFYIGVPNIKSYRNMQPVKSNYKKHNKLGSCLVSGLKSAGVKVLSSKNIPLDLTQTSYSTIASMDIEVGDRATSTSDKNLNKIANGLLKGVKKYFGK